MYDNGHKCRVNHSWNSRNIEPQNMTSPLIRPLKLGPLTFPNNIIQGPLAGISSAPFRRLIWDYSKPAFSCTEMISCKTILYQPRPTLSLTTIDPQEGPVCFQLSGSSPEELAEATKHVTDLGAALINLNCGCPVNKIRSKGAGSRLLATPKTLYALITAMKRHTPIPVSIKIRVDGHSQDQFNQDVATAVSDAGADFLVVHGRHWTENYDQNCHYDQIQFFVETLNVPVIGNGDIACSSSLKHMLQTGCAGVMLARATVGQPWLIARLIAELSDQPFSLPTASEIGQTFLRHVRDLSMLLKSEKFAIIQARKFAKYYARTLPNKTLFCQAINACEQMARLEEICQHYFNS